MDKSVYHTLLIKLGGLWSPQFGDYDYKTVKAEYFDSWKGEEYQIIKTDPTQAAIDSKVNEVNNGVTTA